MSKKINLKELNNVNGGLVHQDSTEGNCPNCGMDISIDPSKARRVTEGCSEYCYYTCPSCNTEFEIDLDD